MHRLEKKTKPNEKMRPHNPITPKKKKVPEEKQEDPNTVREKHDEKGIRKEK